MTPVNLSIQQLLRHYRDGDFTPEELLRHVLRQAENAADYNIWIYLLSLEEIQPHLDKLKDRSPDELPLYGVPFAVKDNIDLAGIPTTAACEDFQYVSESSAYVVQKLLDAGAIPLGKTNLDQFATGLVGTRSPYGAVKNTFDPAYISGGSSSGSAAAVALGLVSFALATDTAGSGRVPAAFNNILGMKPTRGLLSNQGVVPACKSLDCVALFATTAVDLETLFDISAAYDSNDPYARGFSEPGKTAPSFDAFSFAVPREEQLEFFGNDEYRGLFQKAVKHLEKLGGHKHIIDFAPFLEAARLLYEGPWVSERYLACRALIEEKPDALHPVTRAVIEKGKNFSALDTFQAHYQLQRFKKQSDALLAPFDFLLTPTAGTIYTLAAVEQEPFQLNANLGYYTNYMNLLDYAALAVPAGFTSQGLPFGVTLTAEAFADKRLTAYADLLQQSQDLTLGATMWSLPVSPKTKTSDKTAGIHLVVCGSHMQGLSLNHQLLERGAVFVKKCQSAPAYKLFALPGVSPPRPGMVRVEKEGRAIEVEVWRIASEQLGGFLASIPHPLGLGKVELEDGTWETGFICEAYAAEAAEDISHLGGWQAYLGMGIQ